MKRLSNKKDLTVDNLLKVIDVLPNANEQPQRSVYKIIYKDKDSVIGKAVNYMAVRDILDHSPEGEKIRKDARYRIEDLVDAFSTNPPKKLQERAKYLRLLIRLTIIAFQLLKMKNNNQKENWIKKIKYKRVKGHKK